MENEQVDKAIDLLEKVRMRRAMFVGDKRLSSLNCFLTGFQLGLSVYGTELPIREATKNRGWEWTARAGFDQMERRGLSEDEQCLEAIDIYLEALRLLIRQETDAAEPV